MLYNRFFYEGGTEGAGGGSGENGDTTTKPAAQAPDPIITDEDLKTYGIDRGQLKSILQQHKENGRPTEEKEKEEQVRKANFIKYSAEQGLMKVEDFNTYETLKSKADRDLVFEKYLGEWKEDNPDVTDDAEVQSQARESFENDYRLNSENAKQKERGESRLKKEAEALRSPYTSKHAQAESQFNEHRAMEGKVPEFNKFIENLINKCTPDKLVISKVKDDKDEIEIDVELTPADRKELVDTFRTSKTFYAFDKEKDTAKVEASMTKKIEGFLKQKHFDKVAEKAYTLGKKRGTANGSNVGAEQPFGVVKGGKSGGETDKLTLEKSNEKIAAARRRYAR